MDEQEKKYKDGFNSGYFLAEHEPELASKIFDSVRNFSPENEYMSGFSTGHDVYITERIFSKDKEDIDVTDKEKETTPEKKNPEEEYKKGFNNGYLLMQYEPQLAIKLIGEQETPSYYHQGLTDGKEEFVMEKVREQMKDMSQNETPPKDNEKDMDRDR